MEQFNDFYVTIALIIRTGSLVILFIWGFYRAFVTDFLIRRILFAMLTFTTVLFMTLAIDTPANPYRSLFYLNLASLVIYEFAKEMRTERFFDAFKTARSMRKKLMDITHQGQHQKPSAIKH